MANIFIGGAWPYANGSLHLGRLASVLPGDVLARYFRAKGDHVLYVSGSDCHGTPVSVQASQAGISPQEIASKFHEEFTNCFTKLGFTYDLYTRTDQHYHHRIVQELFLELLNNGYLYRKTERQAYCETEQRFLPDRYVEGTCPVCGSHARGDQCDACSTLLDPSKLLDRTCKTCGDPPSERPTEHFYLELSKFQAEIMDYVGKAHKWGDNAIKLTRRYLEEGLQDRAVTRDLEWGVNVPVDGYNNKKIYVWIEAVSGYLSASKQWAKEYNCNWEPFWKDSKDSLTAYYVHGKDNILFHTIIWPAILLGVKGLHLPDRIISSEYLTLEGKKFSTSRNWAVWLPDILSRYDSDSIRYFLIANGPEKRDTDFSWREFIYSHNGELLGAFGNFVNRTLAFINKSFNGHVPNGRLEGEYVTDINHLYQQSGALIEDGQLKEALELIFSFVRQSNKFFDEQKPWAQFKQNKELCGNTLYHCVQIIANLANLLQPFLPFSCEKIRGFLNLGPASWSFISVPVNQQINKIDLLFERIDPKQIDEEVHRLHKQKQ